MKLFKYIFFLLLIALIVGAVYYGTKDGSYNVVESRIIEAPATVIFTNVNDFKNWETWGPWMDKDPNMKVNYAEKTTGEGASYSWNSDHPEVGDGAMKTVKVIPNKEIQQQIVFNTPIGDSTSEITWIFEGTEDPRKTKVTWAMQGESSLLEKVFLSFQEQDLESSITQMFTQGLEQLDASVQDSMQEFAIYVDGITNYGGGYYMYATTSSTMQDMSLKMEQLVTEVSNYTKERNITPAGPAFTIYNEVNEGAGTIIFSAGIPVREQLETPPGSPVISGYMEPVTAVKVTLKGAYKNLEQAYAKGLQYIGKNNLIPHPTANQFEVYTTDPSTTLNPAEYITEIYLPILQQEPTPQTLP